MITTEYIPKKSIFISLRNIPRADLLEIYFSLRSYLGKDVILSIHKSDRGFMR